MSLLVAKAPVSVWTLFTMNAIQIAETWPETRRFFECGFKLDCRRHADGVIGLTSPLQDLTYTLETGEFQ